MNHKTAGSRSAFASAILSTIVCLLLLVVTLDPTYAQAAANTPPIITGISVDQYNIPLNSRPILSGSGFLTRNDDRYSCPSGYAILDPFYVSDTYGWRYDGVVVSRGLTTGRTDTSFPLNLASFAGVSLGSHTLAFALTCYAEYPGRGYIGIISNSMNIVITPNVTVRLLLEPGGILLQGKTVTLKSDHYFFSGGKTTSSTETTTIPNNPFSFGAQMYDSYTITAPMLPGYEVTTTECYLPQSPSCATYSRNSFWFSADYKTVDITFHYTPLPPTITASPSPCAIPTGATSCTSTILWSAPAYQTVQIWGTVPGQSPQLFHCANVAEIGYGSKDASWITTAGATFKLYNTPDCTTNPTGRAPDATVTVKGIVTTLTASPNPCNIYTYSTSCTSTISWTAAPAQNVQVWASTPGFADGQVSCKAGSGSTYPSWITTATTTFKLYNTATCATSEITGKTPAATVAVRGVKTTITATPTSCTVDVRGTCTTTISWTAPSMVQIWGNAPGQTPQLFACSPGSGSQVAPWITTAGFNFRLYKTSDCTTNPTGSGSDANITVSGTALTLSASPNPCTVASGASSCTTTLSRTVPSDTVTQLWVTMDTNAPGAVACTPGSSTLNIPWIVPGHTYRFDLYKTATCSASEITGKTPNATVNVTGTPPSTITAFPLFCTLASDGTCSSAISWTAASNQVVQIWAEGSPVGFACTAGNGSQSAPWITTATTTFKLYNTSTCSASEITSKTPNATVNVKGTVPVTGYIDGVIKSGTSYTVNGWACQKGSPTPINVQLYLGGPAGSGGTKIGTSTPANRASESGVATACQTTGMTYRYAIPLDTSTLTQYAGKLIYVYGISPTGGANTALMQSGKFVVPSPTTATAASPSTYSGQAGSGQATIIHSLAKTWTGPEVSALQAILTTLGLYTDEITGYFGSLTEQAVIQFQQQNNLAGVGIVGPQTRSLLQQLMGW